jgi:hypothetical protein
MTQFNQCNKVPCIKRSVDQIAFPMSDSLARLHFRRTGVNHSLVRYSSPTTPLLTGATTPPFAPGTGKVLPQTSTGPGVGVDVFVDRLLAHPCPSLQSGSVANHIRRPTLFETRLNIDPYRIREPARSSSSGVLLRPFLSLFRSVSSFSRVPQNLSIDAAGGTNQSPRNLPHSMTFLTPAVDVRTFFRSHALVDHIVLLVSHTKNVVYRVTLSNYRCCNSRSRARVHSRANCSI